MGSDSSKVHPATSQSVPEAQPIDPMIAEFMDESPIRVVKGGITTYVDPETHKKNVCSWFQK